MSGLGLSGAPTIYSLAYLKANIEGGEKFNWFYADGAERRRAGSIPTARTSIVSLPEGDRLAQARSPYSANQQLLANKQLRWWWNNPHQAIYDDGDGTGWAPHGPPTDWVAAVEIDRFLEYGFPACDKATNQPNVFFDPKSSGERDALLVDLGSDIRRRLRAAARRHDRRARAAGDLRILERRRQQRDASARASPWSSSRSAASGTGTRGRFRSSRCWQCAMGRRGQLGRPAIGSNGRGAGAAAAAPSPPPTPGAYPTFPDAGDARLVDACAAAVRDRRRRPRLGPLDARAAPRRAPLYDVELTYELLRADASLSRVAGDRRLLRRSSAARRRRSGSRRRASRSSIGQTLGTGDGVDDDVSAGRIDRRLRRTGRRDVGRLGGLSRRRAASALGLDASRPAMRRRSLSRRAPAAGVAVSADFGVLWLCRFADDVADFEEFMAMLFGLQSTLKLTTARATD